MAKLPYHRQPGSFAEPVRNVCIADNATEKSGAVITYLTLLTGYSPALGDDTGMWLIRNMFAPKRSKR